MLIDQPNDLKRSTFPVYVRDKMKPRESLSYRYTVTSLPSLPREKKTCAFDLEKHADEYVILE